MNFDPLQLGSGPDVLHIQSRTMPEFRFEYHPRTRSLYKIAEGKHIANRIVQEVNSPEQAKQIVQAMAEAYRDALVAVNTRVASLEQQRRDALAAAPEATAHAQKAEAKLNPIEEVRDARLH